MVVHPSTWLSMNVITCLTRYFIEIRPLTVYPGGPTLSFCEGGRFDRDQAYHFSHPPSHLWRGLGLAYST